MSAAAPKRKPLKLTALIPDEAAECAALIEWRDKVGVHRYPQLKLLYHIPNGGYRYRWTAIQLKRQGVKPGVPDFHLPVGRGGFLSLYLEMKRRDGGTVSADQSALHGELREAGNQVRICRGWEEAAALLEEYLRPKTHFQPYAMDD